MNAFTPEDLDLVMFKCMTTMGGEDSFRFFLPLFLKAVLDGYPDFVWLSRSHVMASKCELVEWSMWKKPQRDAALNALEAFARYERALAETETEDEEPWDGVKELLLKVELLRRV